MAKGYKLSSLRAEDDTSSKGMNKYGLAAVNKDGKFYSYRNGKLTGTSDNMKDLQKHQHDLIKNEDLAQMAHKVEQDLRSANGKIRFIQSGKIFNQTARQIKKHFRRGRIRRLGSG